MNSDWGFRKIWLIIVPCLIWFLTSVGDELFDLWVAPSIPGPTSTVDSTDRRVRLDSLSLVKKKERTLTQVRDSIETRQRYKRTVMTLYRNAVSDLELSFKFSFAASPGGLQSEDYVKMKRDIVNHTKNSIEKIFNVTGIETTMNVDNRFDFLKSQIPSYKHTMYGEQVILFEERFDQAIEEIEMQLDNYLEALKY